MKCSTCKHSGQLPDDIFQKRLIKCCEKGHWCEGSSKPPGDPKRWENCTDYQDTTEYINMLYNLPFGISRQDARERMGIDLATGESKHAEIIVKPEDMPEFLRKWEEELQKGEPGKAEEFIITARELFIEEEAKKWWGTPDEKPVGTISLPKPPTLDPQFPPMSEFRSHRDLVGYWGKLNDPFAGMPGYEPADPQPEFLQDAVNLSIELSASIRETEQLKTFLKELHLLTAFQDWRAEQDEKETEL